MNQKSKATTTQNTNVEKELNQILDDKYSPKSSLPQWKTVDNIQVLSKNGFDIFYNDIVFINILQSLSSNSFFSSKK